MSAETTDNTVCVTIEAEDKTRPCPQCGYESAREHSRYVRRPRDLPIQGRIVTLRAIVRRFRCGNQGCSKRTFAESLGSLAVRHAQRTARLTETLQALILNLSSCVGARLAAHLGIRTSPSTLLRVIGHDGHVTTPRVLGVDDFALRRGHNYGTLLCNLETGRPNVLIGRKAEPLAEWLRSHPGVEIIARDRASAYADAARRGAPEAVQVADRFHLVKNVGDALREVLDQKCWALPVPTQPPVSAPAEPASVSSIPVDAAPDRRRNPVVAERRRKLYEELQHRRANGDSLRAISEATGASTSTLKRYLRMPTGPKPTVRRRQRRNTDSFLDYLRQRWNEGCHSDRYLFAELAERGYTGSIQSLRRVLTEWRRCEPKRPSAKTKEPKALLPKVSTWKDLRWFVLSPPEHLRPEQAEPLTAFLALHPELDRAYELAQSFRTMLKDKCSDQFAPWITSAANSGLSPFQRLARTLQADRDAVLAGIQLQWSTGPVEGHVNRVKLLKRMGYGRAGLALLRARIVGVA